MKYNFVKIHANTDQIYSYTFLIHFNLANDLSSYYKITNHNNTEFIRMLLLSWSNKGWWRLYSFVRRHQKVVVQSPFFISLVVVVQKFPWLRLHPSLIDIRPLTISVNKQFVTLQPMQINPVISWINNWSRISLTTYPTSGNKMLSTNVLIICKLNWNVPTTVTSFRCWCILYISAPPPGSWTFQVSDTQTSPFGLWWPYLRWEWSFCCTSSYAKCCKGKINMF